ncbi:N-acetylglucosamine kinase [Nocardioides sp. DS6]|uniref:N-acetylglucosamine kinase n=1 Tax=Nocardioides eburneus TaxID=3231482 RepID=A0ABV3T2R8_9ACTN
MTGPWTTTPPSAYVAVDGGGTSTRSVVVDATGRRLGVARAGSGNPVSAGTELSARSITESVAAALAAAGLGADRLGLLLLAVAGTGSPTHREELRRRLIEAGLVMPVVFESDLLAMFAAGTHVLDGYALVAGTGAAAIRVEDGRQVAVADGLGWLLGDDGSGFWIGRRVVRAALADLDGRGPTTALTSLLLGRLGLAPDVASPRETVAAAVSRLYADRPVRLAEFARLAFEARGDEAAATILRGAGSALARTLHAVAVPPLRGPVVLGGSILAHHPDLGAVVAGELARILPDGEEPVDVRTVTDGLTGAAVLALRRAGLTVDEAVHARLRSSIS